jgi:hypothetical protein
LQLAQAHHPASAPRKYTEHDPKNLPPLEKSRYMLCGGPQVLGLAVECGARAFLAVDVVVERVPFRAAEPHFIGRALLMVSFTIASIFSPGETVDKFRICNRCQRAVSTTSHVTYEFDFYLLRQSSTVLP